MSETSWEVGGASTTKPHQLLTGGLFVHDAVSVCEALRVLLLLPLPLLLLPRCCYIVFGVESGAAAVALIALRGVLPPPACSFLPRR